MAIKETNKTKILVKVHEPLIAILQHKIDAACLKRDAYLDKALRIEAQYLRLEIKTPNSDKAKNFIAAQLSELKLKPLNLLLSTETVDLINEVCKEKNVPRDAFMNRFFLLLIASEAVLTALFYDVLEEYSESVRECSGFQQYVDNKPYHDWDFYDLNSEYPPIGGIESLFCFRQVVSGLDGIEHIAAYTPFMQIRVFIDGITEDMETYSNYCRAMYSYPFKKDALQKLPSAYSFLKTDNSLGFNTFMTDRDIEVYEIIEEFSEYELKQISEKDKLLKIIQEEKQARAEKEKRMRQARLEKTQVKAEGEVK